jgi:2-dehydropantoate 2-reductase
MNKHTGKYAVIGTGAVGGYYGSLLARAGQDVHFLLHSDYEHVRDHGLKLDSINGDFTLPEVHAYKSVDDMPACQTVILALKTTKNHMLSRLLPAVIKEDGYVLILQNGLGIEDDVAGIVGPDRVMSGLCFLCSNKIGPGHIHHMDYGQINLGDYSADHKPKGITQRLKSLAKDLTEAGIQVNLIEDLITARWKKLVWNIPYSGLTAILNTTTDKIMADRESRLLVENIMREIIEAAGACGHVIDKSFVEEMLKATDEMAAYKPSMLLDYEKGESLEVETIYGKPIRIANAAGFKMSLTDTIYHKLKFLDNLNRADS